MKFVDTHGSEWEAIRRLIPWQPKCPTATKLKGSSILDGSNDPVGIAIGLLITLVLLLPILVELLFELLLLPFAVALRSAGVVNTTVHVRCTQKVVGFNNDGSKIVETSGASERWELPVSGFGRAGRLRDALADFIRQHGRSADVDGFAAQWLSDHPS